MLYYNTYITICIGSDEESQGASGTSIDDIVGGDSEEEVKRKHDKDNGICTTVTHNEILYTGMMYHEKKGEAYWKSMYTVVRDLDALKQV